MLLLSMTFVVELIVILFAMHKITRCFSTVSIPGLAFIFVFLWHGWYVPVFLLNGRLFNLTLSNALRLRFFAVLSLMYIFFFIGVIFMKEVLHFNLRETVKYRQKPLFNDLKSGYPVLYIILAGMIILTLYFLLRTPASPIAYIQYAGETGLLRQLRNQIRTGATTDYLFGIGRFVIFPLVTLVFIGIAKYERTMKAKIIALIAFTTTSVALVSTLHKGDLFPFLAMVIIFLWLYRGKIQYPLIRLALIVGAFILLASGIYASYYDTSLLSGSHALFSRVTVGPNYSLALHLMYFPDKFGFLYGGSIGLLNRILGNKDFLPLGVLVAHARGIPRASFNAVFISGLWADFGYPGVIIGSFLLGVYLEWLQIWLVRSAKSISNLVLFAYLLVAVYYLANVSIYPSLITYGLLSGPIFILLIQFLAAVLRSAEVGLGSKGPEAFPAERET